ncbi:MAG: hypothetical protein M5U34_42010 [Chloroflexi bacterium]|nr:hypothetical protein [Chloroflexota bacterium]
MSIGSILLALALLIISGLFLAQPFWWQGGGTNGRSAASNGSWRKRKRCLKKIRALDFDRETNKIPDDVYQAQREQLVAVATAVLQESMPWAEKRRRTTWPPKSRRRSTGCERRNKVPPSAQDCPVKRPFPPMVAPSFAPSAALK